MNTIGPKPILKWAGGKRQLLASIDNYLPEKYGTYYEPFLGGAAVLLHLLPKKAVVNDLNEELINTYLVVKESPKELITLLLKHSESHSPEHYYEIRELDRNENYCKLSPIEKAARTIYLNRTCYNGLYRVNKNGYFNTPIGKYENPLICDEKGIMLLHDYLCENDIKIMCGSYFDSLVAVKRNDFVYFDPPYDIVSKTSSFTDYTSEGFGKKEQIELKSTCDLMNKKGVKFLQSNSDTEFLRELYKDYKIITVEANRSINSKGNNRKNIKEILIMNY